MSPLEDEHGLLGDDRVAAVRGPQQVGKHERVVGDQIARADFDPLQVSDVTPESSPAVVGVTIARTGEEVTQLKGKRHTPGQIVRKLREADRLQAEGADVDAVCRQLKVWCRPASVGGASSKR